MYVQCIMMYNYLLAMYVCVIPLLQTNLCFSDLKMLASKSQSSEVRIDLVPQAAALCPNEKLVLLIKVLHDANGTHRRFKTLLDIILESRVWDY